MRVWNQWSNEHRTTRKTASGRRKVSSVHNNQHSLRMLGNDRTASYRQLTAQCAIEQHSDLPLGSYGLRVRFRFMDDPICYKLRVISIATGTSVKCYRPELFPSFKTSLELSFSRIRHAHMLQRLFETSAKPNTCKFFLGLLIHLILRLLNTCGDRLVIVLLMIRVL
ncbi:transposable element Tcb1 transposase [Trichonephila clavipes]|nr:transposable element Tcb1 transposase [Trichonephila clavipes]